MDGLAIHDFLLAQFDFLVMICRGNNEEVIESLKADVDYFKFIMFALKDKEMKECPRLRAMLVELLKGKF